MNFILLMWKNLPSWLKGGIVGSLVWIGILIISFIVAIIGGVEFVQNTFIIHLIVKILAFPTAVLLLFLIDPIHDPILWYGGGFLSGLIAYFAIGSAINLILKKAKS
jgi:hypothetical protein